MDKRQAEGPFYFKEDILVLFLHNRDGTPELPDSGNIVGADWMESLRWGDTEPSMHFREANTYIIGTLLSKVVNA